MSSPLHIEPMTAGDHAAVIDLWTELDPAIDALISQFPWIGQPYNRGP